MNTCPRLALCLCASVVVALSGCTSTRDPALAGPPYPETAKTQDQTLDIQVVRGETSITLTNTTARSFGLSRLWVNRWYSHGIEELGVGETIELPLNTFRDEYGESFRAGGFFATRKPQRVQQVQLETADGLVGLVAVGKESE